VTPPIPLLTIPEVAAILKCRPWTVYSEIRKKRLKKTKVGRLTRVRQSELERYLFAKTR
jgi:excisionase family DNA binding protein